VLLLDEPTNDLDTDTLAALEDLLDTWPGTMIVASHDRYLVERVTETTVALLGDGRLTHLPGGVDEYLSRVHSSGALIGAPAPAGTPASAPGTGAGLSAADVRTARKELTRLERQVRRLAEQETKLHEELATHATDYAKVAELDLRLRQTGAEREAAELAWLELAEHVGTG
jgi:DNA repair exonuclease SbcCD ATPase subunit